MKTIKIKFFFILFVSAFTIESYCQSDKIVADSKPFKYLIGMEYSKVSELGGFELKSRGSKTYPNGEKTCSANLVQGEKQIITSEITTLNKKSNLEVYKILDVIVLNGYFTTCGGCYLSKKKNNEILTIYPLDTTNNDTILVAFERNGKTGKYKKVNPVKLKLNPLKTDN